MYASAADPTNDSPYCPQSLTAGVDALRDVGAQFYQRNWSLGTSSNYSILLQRQPQTLLITASGKDKGMLAPTDFVLVGNDHGRASMLAWPGADRSDEKPSAETALHLMLTERPGVGSVLHTHSVWSTLLSDEYGDQGGLWITGYEMLKGLARVVTHEHREWVPIFANSQDIPTLARQIRGQIDAVGPEVHGFLLRGHGLYTWGRNLTEARRHVEIFEFLFEVLGRRLTIR